MRVKKVISKDVKRRNAYIRLVKKLQGEKLVEILPPAFDSRKVKSILELSCYAARRKGLKRKALLNSCLSSNTTQKCNRKVDDVYESEED